MNGLVSRIPTARGLSLITSVVLVCSAGCGSEPDTTAYGQDPVVPGSDAATGNGFSDGSVVGNPDAAVASPTDCTLLSPDVDSDMDGFTPAQGDCNDCDPLINPAAYDFPGNAYDEDCSGAPAQEGEDGCDVGLDIASGSPEDAARSLGLCKFTTEESGEWGVISARFTTADGSGTLEDPMQVGLLPDFGVVEPLAGSSMLALSSGAARAPGQPGFTSGCEAFSGRASTPPAGYPKRSSACVLDNIFGNILPTTIFNQAALELTIRVPSNAYSLSFDSIFYSYEYPDYICSPYNDFYVAFLTPQVSSDGNIVFDSNEDPIGVNTGLLAVCDPSQQGPFSQKTFACEQGTSLLQGTGFGAGEYTCGDPVAGQSAASTGWLKTLAPVEAGSVVTLRFAVWDTGDADLDSTVLLDRFEWSVEQPTGASTVPTPPVLL